MLVLARRNGQGIHIGDNIEVKVISVRGATARLGIRAPANVTVHRDELYDRIAAAANRDPALPPPTHGVDIGALVERAVREGEGVLTNIQAFEVEGQVFLQLPKGSALARTVMQALQSALVIPPNSAPTEEPVVTPTNPSGPANPDNGC